MTRKPNYVAAILTILLVCNLCLIWGSPLANDTGLSPVFLDFLAFLLTPFQDSAQRNTTIQILIHVTEFAFLGGISGGLLISYRKVRLQPVIHLLSAGLLAANIDETIHLLANLNAQLQTVWMDFIGFAGGSILVLGIHAFVTHPQIPPENIIAFPGTQFHGKSR